MKYRYIKIQVGRRSSTELLNIMNDYGSRGYRFVMATDGYLFFEQLLD